MIKRIAIIMAVILVVGSLVSIAVAEWKRTAAEDRSACLVKVEAAAALASANIQLARELKTNTKYYDAYSKYLDEFKTEHCD